MDKIAAQIHSVGFTQPILVDKDNIIIAGHGRREAALRLGLKEVPVIVADHLDEYQVKAFRIADNKVAESEWDDDKLKFELGTLQHHDFDLKLTGFDLSDIDDLLDDDEVEVTEDEEDEDDSAAAEQEDLEDEAETQFIVSVHCKDEDEMAKLHTELSARGLDCKLIT